MVHNIQRWHDKRREVLEDAICLEFQREIRRAIAKVREAHEILSSVMVSQDNSIQELLQDREPVSVWSVGQFLRMVLHPTRHSREGGSP